MYEVDQDQLRKVERTFRALPKDLKNSVRRYQRSEATPIWREEMSTRAGVSKLTSAVFKSGTTVKAGAVLTLRAGASNRKLSGGATPSELARPAEFGSNRRDKYTRYNRRSQKGTTHTVERRAGRQIPSRRASGYVVGPASRPTISRLTSLQVATIVRSIYEATEL